MGNGCRWRRLRGGGKKQRQVGDRWREGKDKGKKKIDGARLGNEKMKVETTGG